MRVSIDKQVYADIMNYLSTRPYREVAKIISEAVKDAHDIKEDEE